MFKMSILICCFNISYRVSGYGQWLLLLYSIIQNFMI